MTETTALVKTSITKYEIKIFSCIAFQKQFISTCVIIFKSINQMWIRNVLTYHISIFLVNFCFLTNYFYSFSTWTCWGLHYVHMLIICGLSIHTELPIIIWKNVCLWTKWKIVWIRKHSLSPLNVFPHQVFSSKLKTLRKMINLLVLWSVFELFRFAHACP